MRILPRRLTPTDWMLSAYVVNRSLQIAEARALHIETITGVIRYACFGHRDPCVMSG